MCSERLTDSPLHYNGAAGLLAVAVSLPPPRSSTAGKAPATKKALNVQKTVDPGLFHGWQAREAAQSLTAAILGNCAKSDGSFGFVGCPDR